MGAIFVLRLGLRYCIPARARTGMLYKITALQLSHTLLHAVLILTVSPAALWTPVEMEQLDCLTKFWEWRITSLVRLMERGVSSFPHTLVHGVWNLLLFSFLQRAYTEEELNAKLTRRVQKAARRQAKQEELKRLHRAQVVPLVVSSCPDRNYTLLSRKTMLAGCERGDCIARFSWLLSCISTRLLLFLLASSCWVPPHKHARRCAKL